LQSFDTLASASVRCHASVVRIRTPQIDVSCRCFEEIPSSIFVVTFDPSMARRPVLRLDKTRYNPGNKPCCLQERGGKDRQVVTVSSSSLQGHCGRTPGIAVGWIIDITQPSFREGLLEKASHLDGGVRRRARRRGGDPWIPEVLDFLGGDELLDRCATILEGEICAATGTSLDRVTVAHGALLKECSVGAVEGGALPTLRRVFFPILLVPRIPRYTGEPLGSGRLELPRISCDARFRLTVGADVAVGRQVVRNHPIDAS
jgi:hypothetical protein